MAYNYKVAQKKPASGSHLTGLERIYVVPPAKSFVGSSILAASLNAPGAFSRFSIAVVPGGGAPTSANAIHWNVSLKAGKTRKFMDGISLAAGDEIYVGSSDGNVAFTLFGSENG